MKSTSTPTSILRTVVARCLGSVIRPTPLRTVLKVVRNSPEALSDYIYDSSRYLRYSSTFYYPERANRLSRITAMYHSVERGLALPEPRPGFGAENMMLLVEAIEEYVRRFGLDENLRPAVGSMDAYLRFHERVGCEPPNRPRIEEVVESLSAIREGPQDGGTVAVKREQILRVTAGVTEDFFRRRHSVRQFTAEEVAAEDIDAAIAIAQKTPAVCNRQECRVHVVHDRKIMDEMLELQETRGFNRQINKLLLVTNTLSAFYGMNERNQCWIDGGLFAMSLVYGLHSRGLGTCFLNWSKSSPRDKAMRRLLNLSPQEVIIVLVAVGHLPEQLDVARSARPPLDAARRHIYSEADI